MVIINILIILLCNKHLYVLVLDIRNASESKTGSLLSSMG